MKFSVEHIGLAARNPTTLKDWYVSVLGAKLVYSDGKTPPTHFLELPGGLLVEIYASGRWLEETGNNTVAGWRHLALRVGSIEKARTRLSERGINFSESIKPATGGGCVLFFRDVEGNLLHLVERKSGSASPLRVTFTDYCKA